VESRYLGPKKALLLVEVGGEYLLLASSDTGLTLIKAIDMLEEIEIIDEPSEQSSFATMLNRLRQTS
jgi:flagellar protein FliO/FliZ